MHTQNISGNCNLGHRLHHNIRWLLIRTPDLLHMQEVLGVRLTYTVLNTVILAQVCT